MRLFTSLSCHCCSASSTNASHALIGFSRLYLGVHWPLDVVGGWAIGGLLLCLFARARPFFAGENQSLLTNLAWVFLIPPGTLALSALVTTDALPKDVWVTSGAYLGFWVGAVLEERFAPPSVRRERPIA